MTKLKRKAKFKRKQQPTAINDVVYITAETKHILSDIKWLEDLAAVKKFSLDWCLTLLEEIALQCMGKRPVIVTDIHGNKRIKYLYRDQGALKAIETIAKLQGHKLTEILKLDLMATAEIEHKHTVEIPINAERTGKVIDILSRCGKFQSRTKQLDAAEVVEVHTA